LELSRSLNKRYLIKTIKNLKKDNSIRKIGGSEPLLVKEKAFERM
jgi:hypothetical protein